MSDEKYKVYLVVTVGHRAGPEPEWAPVARAAAMAIAGETLSVDGATLAVEGVDIEALEID